MIFNFAAVKVGDHRRPLARADVGELRLLEIGVDPHLVKRHHRHQWRARTDPLAELHAALGDESGYWRPQRRTRVREIGFPQLARLGAGIARFARAGLIEQALQRFHLERVVALACRGFGEHLPVTRVGWCLAARREPGARLRDRRIGADQAAPQA